MYDKLILISAPPGFGKTTLLCEWIQQSKMPVAWLSLDRSDNDPVRFLIDIVAALNTIEDNMGEAALSILNSPNQPSLESVLTSLINDISAIPYDFVLVLDDYHLVEAPPVHNTLTFLIDHLPVGMHLVIATRVDPPLPLARLRGGNQLTDLRAADLCFNPEETTLFFNQVLKMNLSSEDIFLLQSRTEGWIAGLQLAALSLKGRADVNNFIKSFAGDDRHIVDYLAEEVLNRQQEHIQKFLLQTSILNRLCGALCNAITGQNNSQQITNGLEKANLFILPLDSKRHWYRYHHLFADLLHHRLQQEQPEQLADLHLQACEWYATNGLVSEAIDHALSAGDFQRAADLVETIAINLILQSHLSTILGWLAKLPEELVTSRPWLCISRAWAWFATGQIDSIEPLLQNVESKLVDPETLETAKNHSTSDILGHIMAIRAYMAYGRGEIQRSIELSRETLKHLPEDNLIVNSAISYNLGYTYLISGKFEAAARYLEQANISGQAAENSYIALAAIGALADLQMKRGHLHKAAKILRQALQLGAEWGGSRPLPATGYVYVSMGQLFLEWNDLNASQRHLTEGINLGEQAEEIDRKATGILDVSQEWQPRFWRIRLWLAQHNTDATSPWAAARESAMSDEPAYLNEFEHLTLARVLITLGKSDEAVTMLNRLLKVAKAEKRTGSVIEILMLQALALEAQGDSSLAMIALGKALALAEPGGYVRLFVDESLPMAELIEQLLDTKVDFPRSYAKKLLFALKLSTPSSTDAALLEPLSERELDVLRCITAGLSNREITEKLFISLNTVKTHLKNINDKLNVRSRTQAVARARELEIL